MEKKLHEPFKLNPSVFPVKGKARSLLYEVGVSGGYYLIPNALYEILINDVGYTIADIIKKYAKNEKEIEISIIGYFKFLIEKDLIFFTNIPDNYPKISLSWDFPSIITNSIIDIGDNFDIDFKSILPQLEKLGCYHLQLRFFRNVDDKELSNIMSLTEDSIFKSVEIILPFNESNKNETWINLITKYKRLRHILIYNSPKEEIIKNPGYKGMHFIVGITKNLINESCCGEISSYYFTSNINLLSESQKYNSCLNRKISIDQYGNIKNCPSMKSSFGNITQVKLSDVVHNPEFNKYWNINKDQIKVCQDCEFRHVCTDCRAYLETPNDPYSKPLKCGYNPYTNIWENWSTNPLKQKAKEYYEI